MTPIAIAQQEICHQIEQMPSSVRLQIIQTVLQSLASDIVEVPIKRKFLGFLKNGITMSADFDAPLDCMKEYME